MNGFPEVADVFRIHGPAYRQAHDMPLRQLRAMRAIEICRTAELGGHMEACDHCGVIKISYNSCRNRHCPKCQSLDKERWIEAREKDLLPIVYFHPVFTLPEGLRPLALRNQRVVYDLFFRAVSQTIQELTEDPKHLGAKVGFILVLHTWTQKLMDHPHLHCIVPGGGLSLDEKQWIPCKKDFFLPVEVLSAVFQGKFLAYLKKAYKKGLLDFSGKIAPLKDQAVFNTLLNKLYARRWVVYCKPPFSGPEKVMEYLGRYTHRVALSNNRLLKLEGDQVTFSYRDRNDNDTVKEMCLDAHEFIRRFLLHILPDGFMKIRHYGILSNRSRKTKLPLCRQLLGVEHQDEDNEEPKESWQDLLTRITGVDPRICPHCGKGRMVLKEVLNASAPPLAP